MQRSIYDDDDDKDSSDDEGGHDSKNDDVCLLAHATACNTLPPAPMNTLLTVILIACSHLAGGKRGGEVEVNVR